MPKKKQSFPLPIVFFTLLIVSLLSAKVILAVFNGGSVLGTKTWIAKGGDDDNSGSGSSSSGSGSSDSDDDNSGSGSSGSSDDSNSGSGRSGSSGSDSDSDDDNSGSSSNNSSGSDSREVQFSSSSSSDDDDDEDEVENETEDESGTRIRTENRDNDQRTEIKISETERIRTRTKDGRTRIDITSGGVKTRLQYEDGRVIVKAEREGLDDVELEDNTIFKIDDRLAKSNIKISTASAESFLVQRGNSAIQTNFPISIDLETSTLSVNTPAGPKTLTVLPDVAVNNLLAAGIVNRLDSSLLTQQFQTGELAAVTDLLTLSEIDDQLVYEIKGISDQRLLGFIPVAIEKDLAVSTETGEVLSEEVGFTDRVLDVFSF